MFVWLSKHVRLQFQSIIELAGYEGIIPLRKRSNAAMGDGDVFCSGWFSCSFEYWCLDGSCDGGSLAERTAGARLYAQRLPNKIIGVMHPVFDLDPMP